MFSWWKIIFIIVSFRNPQFEIIDANVRILVGCYNNSKQLLVAVKRGFVGSLSFLMNHTQTYKHIPTYTPFGAKLHIFQQLRRWFSICYLMIDDELIKWNKTAKFHFESSIFNYLRKSIRQLILQLIKQNYFFESQDPKLPKTRRVLLRIQIFLLIH